MMGIQAWSFAVDEDDFVIAEGPTGTDDNIRLTIETLIIPFGTRAASAETYLREWRRMSREFEHEYTLGTSGASAKRIDASRVEIGDMYGQFETCTMSVDDFERALECLIQFLSAHAIK
ncbi:hypothetical protein P3T37_000740 [Kitasatospora sp. MAA4]|uniref:hypothetical protein n=1 Tax=Kitasatospora sp. MAA4 TaxID=3035093 RepID=UPI0024744155|nr:hypothetical protein [Kitasatospora sp. MAA4]MDH6131371.1 hypothetical protein [Kitasatospora sp. MAA4]